MTRFSFYLQKLRRMWQGVWSDSLEISAHERSVDRDRVKNLLNLISCREPGFYFGGLDDRIRHEIAHALYDCFRKDPALFFEEMESYLSVEENGPAYDLGHAISSLAEFAPERVWRIIEALLDAGRAKALRRVGLVALGGAYSYPEDKAFARLTGLSRTIESELIEEFSNVAGRLWIGLDAALSRLGGSWRPARGILKQREALLAFLLEFAKCRPDAMPEIVELFAFKLKSEEHHPEMRRGEAAHFNRDELLERVHEKLGTEALLILGRRLGWEPWPFFYPKLNKFGS